MLNKEFQFLVIVLRIYWDLRTIPLSQLIYRCCNHYFEEVDRFCELVPRIHSFDDSAMKC